MKKLFVSILLVLLSLNLVYGTENRDVFKYELGNEDETCEISYDFFYISSEQELTEAVTYACCQGDNCEFIVFDTFNLKPFTLVDSKEIFTLDYVKQKLIDGDIDKDMYSINDGFSSCEYVGYKTKLEQENINLGALTLKKAEEYLPENSKKMAKTVIKVGDAAGKIKKFNPGDFAVGVSCKIVVDEEAKSFEKLALCHHYLNNILYRNAYYGLSSDLERCNTEVLSQVKLTLDDITVQLKSIIDKIGSLFKFIADLFSTASEDISQISNVEIEETRFEILTEMKNKLEKNSVNFQFDRAESLAINSYNRIEIKYNNTVNKYNSEKFSFSQINKRNIVEIFFINLIYEPNYDNQNITNLYDSTKKDLKSSKTYLSKYQLNSANNVLNKINSNINKTNELINEQENIERNVDNLVFYVITGIFILIFFYIFFK